MPNTTESATRSAPPADAESDRELNDPQRIYRLKTVLLAGFTTALGLALLFAGKWVATSYPQSSWARIVPLSELGGILFTTGALGVAWTYLDGRDREVRLTERLRRVIAGSARVITDAVTRAFAFSKEDLRRIASPELLDKIARNVLELRLGDEKFANELYDQILEQAITPRERWYDVDVNVRLSSKLESRDTSGVSANEPIKAEPDDAQPHPQPQTGQPLQPQAEQDQAQARVPAFDALVQWEYTLTPSRPTQVFACVADPQERERLLAASPQTSVWLMTRRPGIDPADPACFALLD